MQNCFLIARNKKDNSFQIVKINEKWYLKDRGQDVFKCANSLEAIDLLTSQFRSREQFIERLFANGYIGDKDVDIFVASKASKDGKSYIKFDEVIYKDKRSYRVKDLREVAISSLQTGIMEARDELASIYDDIIIRIYSSPVLYEVIMDGETNIPRSFVEQLKFIPTASDIPYDMKFQSGFGVDSYAAIRNVVDALNRMEVSSREDLSFYNLEFIQANLSDRIALIPELSVQLDENYIDELSLVSDDDARRKSRVASREIVAQEVKFAPIFVKENLSAAKMKREIYRVLDALPVNAFIYDGVRFRVNYGLFKHPLLDDEVKQLNTLLTGNMPKFFADYAIHMHRLQEANDLGDSLGELEEEVQRDLGAILKRFKSFKCINRTYNWCMLWEGCRKRDASYQESGVLGETLEDGKVYGKKQ